MFYMLDTNIVSHFVRAHPIVNKRILSAPRASICISVLAKAELLYGLERKQVSGGLHGLLNEFIDSVACIVWDESVAVTYANLRVNIESRGRPIAANDLLIGSHALSLDATLVTNDSAFQNIPNLKLEDWTKP